MRLVRCLIALNFVLLAQAAEAKVYALTIGIDQYTHIPSLEGAVNDSDDIAETLKRVQGAHVVQLTNAQATKANINKAWRELTEKAGPGDHLVLHVAGHGAVQPAVFPEVGEALDNMYLLTGFDLEGAATRERILDNEFAFMFQMEQEATILFVADTCFSGTLARSAGIGSELKVRRLPTLIEFKDDQLKADLLALGPPPPASENPNLFEIYAGAAGKTIPEVKIRNQMRGALSYSVARAFEGKADKSKDQAISAKELRRFVRRQVREHANGLQHPETKAGSSRDLAFPTTVQTEAPSNLEKLSLYVSVSSETSTSLQTVKDRLRLNDILLSDDLSKADLILEVGATEYNFYNSTRDLIYSSSAAINCSGLSSEECATALLSSLQKEFTAVVTKEVFLRRLAERPMAEDVEVWTREAAVQYVQGDRIGILLKTETSNRVFLFALDKYGKITALVDRALRIKPADAKFIGDSQAVPPFGADHLFAVTSSNSLNEFVTWIKRNNGRNLNQALAEPGVQSTIGAELLARLTSKDFSVGTLPIFTIARSE